MPSRPRCRPSPIKARPSSKLLRLAALALALAVGQAHATPAAQVKRQQLKHLHGRIQTLSRDLVKSEATRSITAGQLKAAEAAISDINRSLSQLGGQRDRVAAELADLSRQSQRLETQIAAQQAQLAKMLYRQYVDGETDALQILLAGSDPNQAARDFHYLSLLSRARAELLRRLRGTLSEKQRLTEVMRAKHDELDAIESRQQQQRAALLERQQQRQAVLAKISGRIEEQKRQIDTLKRDERRLATLIKRLSRIARKPVRARPPARRGAQTVLRNEHLPEASGFSGNFAGLRGRLRLPTRGEVINRYGASRADGGATWKGLFIRAAAGAEVRAVAPGRVVFAGWLRGFGKLIIVDHGDGYLSVYGNNQSLARKVGDKVAGGEQLAAVGNSGGNPESGLYFELRYQGLTIDPLKWVNLK
ncbi:MAG TPA: peptidoglycan DD-metalloendopeptidase family protein [Rhodocyclaceae bacterium]|nr:peptidoglycan DD-metalloendopeptidase family protein [Rhodocyclaceae bacterium]